MNVLSGVNEMKEVHVLDNWEQVRAVAAPLRWRALEGLAEQARTTKQLAVLLGENPTKLYHHVELLEKVGLVRLVKTRLKRGIVEKYYRAVAREFLVDRHLLERSKGTRKATKGYEALFLSALKATLTAARRSVEAGLINSVSKGRNALMFRYRFAGSQAQIDALMDRIREWIEECRARGQGKGRIAAGLTIAFYPIKDRSKKQHAEPAP
jgi:hypothetical protein